MIRLHLWLIFALLPSVSIAASYDEPVLIPDNLLREGKSVFDTSQSTLEPARTPFKLPWIDIAERRGDLNVQVSGVKLPMNATLPKARSITPQQRLQHSSQRHITAPKRRRRRLPRNANIIDRVKHETLVQTDKILDRTAMQKYHLLKWRHDMQRRLYQRDNPQLASDGVSAQTRTLTNLPRRRRRRDFSSQNVSMQLSIDPASAIRLAQTSAYVLLSLAHAFGCSLRFMAPLVIARRGFNYLEEMCMDWYRGRYLRTTYHQVQHDYHNTYQVPAVLRSLGRLCAQILSLFLLGRFMEYMVVGLDQSHCHVKAADAAGSVHCAWLCCIWWMLTTMGLGHAGATAMAVWGGPFRVQTALQRPIARHIFTKPWKLLNWARDPDRWLRDIASSQRKKSLKPFHPNRLLFPATWQPLYFLQLLAVASAMTGEARLRHVLMRYLLLQQAFGDEWFRMTMVEKRVALGIALVVGYNLATFIIFRSVAKVSSLGTCLIFPYLISVIVTGWMNVSIYFERRNRVKREQSILAPPALDQSFGALAW